MIRRKNKQGGGENLSLGGVENHKTSHSRLWVFVYQIYNNHTCGIFLNPGNEVGGKHQNSVLNIEKTLNELWHNKRQMRPTLNVTSNVIVKQRWSREHGLAKGTGVIPRKCLTTRSEGHQWGEGDPWWFHGSMIHYTHEATATGHAARATNRGCERLHVEDSAASKPLAHICKRRRHISEANN